MYRVNLDEVAQDELVRRTRLAKLAPRTRDRLEMIRLSAHGWSVPRIARHFHLHEQTARRWIKAYVQGGFDALEDRAHLGPPSSVTPDILTAVRACLGQADRTWSARQVSEWVSQTYGLTLGAQQWRRLLRRQGYTYQRTGRHLHHKQDAGAVAAAKQEMAEQAAKAQKGATNCSTSATSTKRASA